VDGPSSVENLLLSVVIITRNTKELLLGLLGSLHKDKEILAQTNEIIIVDNGSTDGTGEAVSVGFPHVILLRNETNRGFAAAVNQAWRRAGGEIILLLNSDTRVLPGKMTRILGFMQDNPNVGAAGPALVYEDMSPQRSFASIPSLTQEIVPRFLLEFVSPARHGGKTWGSVHPEPVDSLIGAALVMRRSVLEAVGGFDERFFFFLEETDFCKRVRQHGWQVIFFPSARIVHYQGKTVGANWVKGRMEYNISLDKFIGKHHGNLYHGFFRVARAVKTLLTLLASTLLFPVLFFNRSMRRRYGYRGQLLLWYLRGCPDTGGLRP
jgi:GT2 family glycosyltransferase